MTHRLAASGLSFLSTTEIDVDERVLVNLPLSTGSFDLSARVTQRGEQRRAGVHMFDYHVSFDGAPSEVQLAIDLHCMHHAVPAKGQRLLPLPDLFEDVRLWFRERRSEERFTLHLPAQIGVIEADGGYAEVAYARPREYFGTVSYTF
jgi:hypothetical protein